MGRCTQLKRIGVLTGGGDCPGLNAVIRAVVKTAIRDFDLEAYGVEDGYQGLVENRIRPLSYDDASGILTVGGTILGTSNKANPFHYRGPAGREEAEADRSQDCVRNVRSAGLDALVCIGGDGTLTIAHRLAEAGVPLVGVPKTIDNDVCETDVTFGFDTAVQIVADAVDRLHTTAQAHGRVMVIETMGRYAGWLALVGGMAGGGDVILIPEIPYSLESVCRVVHERRRMGRRFSIVVVSEGVRPPGGDYVEVEQRTGTEARATVLGHLQRGGSPTARDRVLATQFGREAVFAAARGEFGVMTALRGNRIVTASLERVVDRQRLVDPGCQLVQTARSVGTSFGDD